MISIINLIFLVKPMPNFEDFLYSNYMIRVSDNKIECYNVSGRPTSFPVEKIVEASTIQKVMNELFLSVMKDEKTYNLENNDEMYKELCKMRSKRKKAIQLIYLRTDYLLSQQNILKQVEINSISIAFVFLNQKLNEIHALFDKNTWIPSNIEKFIDMVKTTNCIFRNIYAINESIALMIDDQIDINSDNFFEKKLIILELKKAGIEMEHVCINDIKIKSKFKNSHFYYNDKVVFLAYFRYFYNLCQYDDESKEIRKKIDDSFTVSLPSIDLQIVGMKIFQILFNKRDFLQKYLSNENVNTIMKYFVNFKELKNLEENDADKYFLKSVHEGGGGVITENYKQFVNETEKYFLMEKIISKKFRNRLYYENENTEIEPEIGILGILIECENKIIKNESAGFIVRSKKTGVVECGISKGYGFLDSVLKK